MRCVGAAAEELQLQHQAAHCRPVFFSMLSMLSLRIQQNFAAVERFLAAHTRKSIVAIMVVVVVVTVVGVASIASSITITYYARYCCCLVQLLPLTIRCYSCCCRVIDFGTIFGCTYVRMHACICVLN